MRFNFGTVELTILRIINILEKLSLGTVLPHSLFSIFVILNGVIKYLYG
jgi:hypothetical protein